MQKFQKMIKYLGTAISVVMVGLAILLGFSVRWMFKTWPNLAVDEFGIPSHGTFKWCQSGYDYRIYSTVYCTNASCFNFVFCAFIF